MNFSSAMLLSLDLGSSLNTKDLLSFRFPWHVPAVLLPISMYLGRGDFFCLLSILSDVRCLAKSKFMRTFVRTLPIIIMTSLSSVKIPPLQRCCSCR